MDLETKLNISEIFYSIQGEGSRAGLPCVFIRLQGCNLRCSWCDTPYALEIKQQEKLMSFGEIISEVEQYKCNFIEFTGGEPLQQPDVIELINYFSSLGKIVAIETNGYYSFSNLDQRVIKIMDIKCPGSRMQKFNNFQNIKYLTKNDEIKFVVLDRLDFDFALEIINKYNLENVVGTILFSPVFGKCHPADLADWILSTRKSYRLQLQMHKFIWHPDTRGV